MRSLQQPGPTLHRPLWNYIVAKADRPVGSQTLRYAELAMPPKLAAKPAKRGRHVVIAALLETRRAQRARAAPAIGKLPRSKLRGSFSLPVARRPANVAAPIANRPGRDFQKPRNIGATYRGYLRSMSRMIQAAPRRCRPRRAMLRVPYTQGHPS